MTAPSTKSRIDSVLDHTNLLIADLKALRGEIARLKIPQSSEREHSLVQERFYILETRIWEISFQLREAHKFFSTNLRLSDGDAQ
ncbi:MAG: hypothetical protein ACYCSP_06075 [Acidobacteriaceae bacterium]